MAATGQFSVAGGRAAAEAVLAPLGLCRDIERHRHLTFLDTFDWRVHRAGFILTCSDEDYELADRDTGAVVLRAPAPGDGGLPAALHERLAGALGPRALIPLATLSSSEVVLSARDGEDKTVARLLLTQARLDGAGSRTRLAPRLSVLPLRGYDKAAARLTETLRELPGMEPVESTLFEEAVAAGGRRPGDYTGKLALDLDRGQSTYDAARVVYRRLLDAMRVNEPGVVDDIDSEFLHDFRVAVRRTRSALKELSGALPARTEERFRREFKWLGDVTTPTRDLDVYLLDFPAFRAAVGDAAGDLDPLHRLIAAEQRRAHGRLRRDLRSARYRRLVEDWTAAISDDPAAGAGHGGAKPGAGPAGPIPIGIAADARIAKVGARVLRQGSAIDDDSPPEKLHDLRKRCKELRYLLEFFGSLYDPKLHGALVSALKGLQDNLGEFQDTKVQQHAVEGFADELTRTGDTPAAALLAVGRLVAAFDERERRARAEFGERFASFAGPKNRRRLDALTGSER